MSANSASSLMTTGSISKRIIAFAIPLFLGNLFQQLYNTADSLIVGNFLSQRPRRCQFIRKSDFSFSWFF